MDLTVTSRATGLDASVMTRDSLGQTLELGYSLPVCRGSHEMDVTRLEVYLLGDFVNIVGIEKGERHHVLFDIPDIDGVIAALTAIRDSRAG